MEKKIEWYHDFIDKSYQPKKTDLKVLYYFEPAKGITKDDAIGRIASESSTGTWTTLSKLPKRMKKLMATGFHQLDIMIQRMHGMMNHMHMIVIKILKQDVQ